MVYAFKSSLLNEINTLFPYKDTRGLEVSQKESVNIDTYIDYLTAKAIIEEEESLCLIIATLLLRRKLIKLLVLLIKLIVLLLDLTKLTKT